jgi:hypothetical protein
MFLNLSPELEPNQSQPRDHLLCTVLRIEYFPVTNRITTLTEKLRELGQPRWSWPNGQGKNAHLL